MSLEKHILQKELFLQDDVVLVARQLIGKHLFSNIDGKITGGVIIETEAYRGPEDRASHAYNNRRTERTEVMFWEGGTIYVYLCYGIHNLLNIVTNREGIPHAVLIRAVHPIEGIDVMKQRRKNRTPLSGGPGTVCQALGIDRSHNGLNIFEPPIWIEDRRIKVGLIQSGPRIGVEYAKEDALLPWRFFVDSSSLML